MNFLIFKIIFMLLVLFLLSLPFLPWKVRCTLISARYEKKDRWKNIAFVIETLVVGAMLLCLAPLMKSFFTWLFNLEFMAWLLDKIPGRTLYMLDAIIIFLLNLIIAFLFVYAKKILRDFLDRYVFKDNAKTDDEDEKKKKQRRKAKNRARYQKNNQTGQRKDLKKLRKDSVLVFGKTKTAARVEKVFPSDFKHKEKSARQKPVQRQEEDDLSLKQMIRWLWFGFIGLFYSKEDEYAYIKPGTYRWAKQLNLFGILFAFAYIVLCILVQVPIFFPVQEDSFVYTVGLWFLNNSYVCPTIALALICELIWFLDGDYKDAEEAEAPFMSFMDRLKEDKEVSLTETRAAILDKYGLKYKIRHFEAAEVGGSSTYRLEDKKKAIQNMAAAIRAEKGYVNNEYMQSVEYMFDGKHVLFDTVLYSAVGEYVLHYLFVTLSFGTRVLFVCKDKKEIENISGYLRESFQKITKTSHILWRICTFEKLHEGEKPDILLLTPEQFLEPTLFSDGKSFFNELVDVFVLDTDKILTANNYYCLIMAKKLEKATTDFDNDQNLNGDLSLAVDKRIRYRFFSSGHIQSLENSIRQFFNLEDMPLETFHSFALANRTEVFVWHTGITSTLYVDNGANQVSLEVQIAKDAANMGITDINLITDTAIYSSQRNEISGLSLNNCDLSDRSVGYVIVADDCFNLPNSIYNYSRFSGKKASVLHVVSKPYLLRDYFTSQAENYVAHFELIGKTMSEHAQVRRANIIILLCDAVNGIEQSMFLKRAAGLLGDQCCVRSDEADTAYNLDQCVRMCYEAAFGEDRAYEPQYSLKQVRNSELQNKTFVYIKDSDRLFENLLEHTKTVKLEYINTQGVEYLPVFRDEITQHFIPGQVLVRNNRGYTIKDMSVENGVLVLDDTVPSVNVPMDYVQTRLYSVSNATLTSSFGHDYRAKNSEVTHVDFRIYDAQIAVDTVGYYSIEKALQTVDLAKPNFAKYINLQDSGEVREKIRRSIRTKMLVVELDTVSETEPRAGYLLAVMLQEFMKTVFPHQYRCVSVCPLFEDGVEDELFADETAIRDLYPRIVSFCENAEPGDKASERSGGRLRFAIIEDIQDGNGVVETLIDGSGIMVTNLLHIAADFLKWLHTPDGQAYQYLNFGYEQPPAVFNFEELEKLISQFHHQVERSEIVRLTEDNSCFFCHKALEEGTGERTEDGRLICDRCKESSVSTYEELDKLFEQVMAAIKGSTTVADTIPAPITVDFVSTRELRQRYGEEEERLPIAYCDHVNNRIYVEYGLPKTSVCCSIARGVTELWQDLNMDDDGSDLFRAHPQFVELQVLSGLHMDTEAEALAGFYCNSKGLAELKKELQAQGHNDSFAYFLGKAGKKNRDVPTGEDPVEEILFFSERNPDGLVKVHYERLSDDEKAVYDQIYQAVLAYAERTGPLVREVTKERCFEIMNAVIYDNAEIFWCAKGMGSVMYNSAGIAVDVVFKYIMTQAEYKSRKKKIEKAIKPFLKGIKPSMSDYEAALRTYENIVSIIDYDSIGYKEQKQDPDRDKKPDNLRSIYGVFVEKKAVCAGYAKAFQYITNRLGMECTYVRGPCHDGEWHAWNIIKLEGDYYYVDATWDDHTNTDERKNGRSEVSYDYFCITTQELLKSRNIQKMEQYPECTARKCNYFVRSNLYFEAYDAARLQKSIQSGLKAGVKHFSFKAKDAALMQLIYTRLMKERGFMDILNSSELAKKGYDIYHYFNEEVNVVHIIIE